MGGAGGGAGSGRVKNEYSEEFEADLGRKS